MAFFASCVAASLCVSAYAQQYAGDNIPNSLPAKAGSEIAFFRVSDPSGANSQLTLPNYYNLGLDGQRLKPQNVQRAIINLFGSGRNGADYQGYVTDSLYELTDGPSMDNVAVLTPFFANEEDKGVAYPWDDQSQDSTSNALVWYQYEWAYGKNNMFPHSSGNISTYHVIDDLIAYFQDQNTFPNLKEVVIGGHSMGSQMAQRYAAISEKSSGHAPVTFWLGDPNSMVWLSENHPVQTDCANSDDWPEGLSNYAADNMQYGQPLVARGREAVLNNFQSKQVAWLRSTEDNGDYTLDGCGAYASGANRNERFFNFIKQFPPSCDDVAGGNCDTIDYVAETHNATNACRSPAGRSRLFYDNFDGKGGRASDYGERMQDGDDPHPASQ